MTTVAIFPGTFDPITFGHQDVVMRATRIFDQIIVGVAENIAKVPLFSYAQRIEMVKNALTDYNNVQVLGFSNLLVDFAKQHNARVIIRGVRVATDFEHELQLADMNRTLAADIETVFFSPIKQYGYISSTLVKEVAFLGGNVSAFVNADVAKALRAK